MDLNHRNHIKPIIIPDFFSGLPIIQKSPGVEFVDVEYAAKHNYIERSPVPIEHWSDVDSSEFVGTEDVFVVNRYELVGVMSVPKTIRDRIHRINNMNCDVDEYTRVARSFVRYVVPHFNIHPSSFVSHNLEIHAPGIRNTTMDPVRNRRPGLHLDSWSESEQESREKSKIRFNINLGPGRRAFIFSSAKLDTEARVTTNESSGSDYYRIMNKYPNLDVYRIVLEPGQAYVAATECIIHDATTSVDNKLPSVSYQLRGLLV